MLIVLGPGVAGRGRRAGVSRSCELAGSIEAAPELAFWLCFGASGGWKQGLLARYL